MGLGGLTAPERGAVGLEGEAFVPTVFDVDGGAVGGESSGDGGADEVLFEGVVGVAELTEGGGELGVTVEGGEADGASVGALFTTVGVVVCVAKDAADGGGEVGEVGAVLDVAVAGGGLGAVWWGWRGGWLDAGGVEVARAFDEASADGEGVLEALEDGMGGVVKLAAVEDAGVDEVEASGLVDGLDVVKEAAVGQGPVGPEPQVKPQARFEASGGGELPGDVGAGEFGPVGAELVDGVENGGLWILGEVDVVGVVDAVDVDEEPVVGVGGPVGGAAADGAASGGGGA